MFSAFTNSLKIPELRSRIFYTLALLFVARVGAHIPLPGLDLMPLKFGLLRSYQSALGVEAPLADRLQITAEGFFNYIDPALFDLSVNPATVITEANTTLFPTATVMPNIGEMIVERLTSPQTGRSYGLELMLRRAASKSARVVGGQPRSRPIRLIASAKGGNASSAAWLDVSAT